MIYLVVFWYCFLLYRIRSDYVLHPNEFKVIFLLHILLFLLFSAALLNPYTSSSLPTTPHGRVVGMASLIWNPMLGFYAHCSLWLFPYAWTTWIQHKKLHILTLLVQALLVLNILHWHSLELPNACDYNIPAVKHLNLCG